jgi:hypothetical protein
MKFINALVVKLVDTIGEGGVVAITCYDWSKKDEENNGWTDNLSIEIYNKEVATFIRQNS